jgi:anti-anti-sigma regulatory factor
MDYADLRDDLLSFVEVYRPPLLLVDLSRVPFCSTAIMQSLLRVQDRLSAYGGQMKLCSMNDMVRESFRMLNLEGTAFDIRATAATGVDAVS